MQFRHVCLIGLLACLTLAGPALRAEQLYRDEYGSYELRLSDEWAYRVPAPGEGEEIRRFVLTTERGSAHLTVEILPGKGLGLDEAVRGLEKDVERAEPDLTLTESRRGRLGGLDARISTFVYRTTDGRGEHRRRMLHTALKGDRLVQLRLDFPTAFWVLERKSLDSAVSGIDLNPAQVSGENAEVASSIPMPRPQMAPPPPTHAPRGYVVSAPPGSIEPSRPDLPSIPAPAAAADASYCPRCGKPFADGALFCAYDGTPRPGTSPGTEEEEFGTTTAPENPTVIAGAIPLTERSLLAWRSLLEFAAGSRLTQEQEKATREAVKAAYEKGGALRDEIVEIGRLFDPSALWQLDAAKADALSKKLRDEFKSFASRHPALLAPIGEVIESTGRILVQGKPPLTEQTILAAIEFTDFHLQRLGEQARLSFGDGRMLRRSMMSAFSSMDESRRGKLVDLVFQWSDLRLSWLRLKAEDRQAFEQAFRSRLGTVLTGTSTAAPLPSPPSLKNSLLRDPAMLLRVNEAADQAMSDVIGEAPGQASAPTSAR